MFINFISILNFSVHAVFLQCTSKTTIYSIVWTVSKPNISQEIHWHYSAEVNHHIVTVITVHSALPLNVRIVSIRCTGHVNRQSVTEQEMQFSSICSTSDGHTAKINGTTEPRLDEIRMNKKLSNSLQQFICASAAEIKFCTTVQKKLHSKTLATGEIYTSLLVVCSNNVTILQFPKLPLFQCMWLPVLWL